jgi:endonuclease-3
MRQREKALFVMDSLRRRYLAGGGYRDNPGTALASVAVETEDPFLVLISTILSHRTRDEMTTEASENLFARYDTPAKLAEAPLPDVRRRVRPVNFYVGKAKRVKEVARYVLKHHGGEVPRDYDELLAIPMVGPKTANCVLVYGFGEAAIPVDVHVHRVPNRIGFVRTKTPEETEAKLKDLLPRSYWPDVNELVIRFGKEVCRPVGPRCGSCEFASVCRFAKKDMRGPRRRRREGGSRVTTALRDRKQR